MTKFTTLIKLVISNLENCIFESKKPFKNLERDQWSTVSKGHHKLTLFSTAVDSLFEAKKIFVVVLNDGKAIAEVTCLKMLVFTPPPT